MFSFYTFEVYFSWIPVISELFLNYYGIFLATCIMVQLCVGFVTSYIGLS